MHFFIFMLHFWAVIIKTICPYTNYVKNKTKMFIFNLFSSAFLIFNFLRFLPCILLQRLFYYGSEPIEWFILLNYCVNPFDFSLETYLDLVLTQKNRTKLSFIQCTVTREEGWVYSVQAVTLTPRCHHFHHHQHHRCQNDHLKHLDHHHRSHQHQQQHCIMVFEKT